MAGQKRREVERASIPGNRFEPGPAGASGRGTSERYLTSNARQRARQYKARCHQMRNANASFFATVWLHTLSRLVVIEAELRVVARM